MGYVGPFPLGVKQGGTGDATLTAHAVLIGEGTGDIAEITVGTDGQVLLGSTAADPAFATLTSTGGTIVFTPGASSLNLEASGSTATSFPTDSGTATPSLGALTIAGGTGISTSGSGSTVTITSTVVGGIQTLDGNTGSATGSTVTITTGSSNNSGNALFDASGSTVMLNASDISSNTAWGRISLGSLTSGAENSCFGAAAGFSITSGSQNTVFGENAFASGTITGSGNLALGRSAGNSFNSSGDYNIYLNSVGVNAESHTLRIGNATGTGISELTAAYIAGIDGVNVGSVAKVLTMASDKIGTATITAGTGISVTPSANTITVAAATSVPTTFTADSGTATPSSNNINILGGTNVTTSASGSTVTINSTGGSSFTWNEITGASSAMAVNNGYIANNAGVVTLTLPSTAAVGDVVRVTGKGAGGWQIAQNSGQTIFFGSSTSTPGATGHIDSTLRRDGVELVCVTANNDWNVISAQGNISVT